MILWNDNTFIQKAWALVLFLVNSALGVLKFRSSYESHLKYTASLLGAVNPCVSAAKLGMKAR